MTNRADNFNRSDGAIGTPSDGGSAWSIIGFGNWSVISNQAGCATSAAQTVAYLETSATDGTVQATLATLGTSNALVTRLADSNNYIFASVEAGIPRIQLWKKVAGSFTNFGSPSSYTGSLSANDVLAIEASGNDYTVTLNGSSIITGTTTDLNTNTKVGIRANADTTARLDDFSFTESGGAVEHATSGAIAGGGAAVDGAASSLTVHATSGALAGGGSAVDGAATRTGAVSIAVAEFQSGTVWQRTVASSNASINLSGTYVGSPAAIQARIMQGVSEVVTWTTIDASPSGNTYSAAITVPEGDGYTAEVRFGDDTGTTDAQTNTWGVGAVVAVCGQSNGRNWFSTSGTDYANTLLRWYSSSVSTNTPTQTWRRVTSLSRGAQGFGDRFTSVYTDIPVGFLDCAVGSSGIDTWQQGDSNYEAAEAAIDAHGGCEGIIWVNGEADSIGGATQSYYEDRLYNNANSFIKGMRADVTNGSSFSNLPVYISILGRGNTVGAQIGDDDEVEAIRAAQYHVATTVADCFVGAYAADLDLVDGIHYTADSYEEHGRRVGQAVLVSLGDSTDAPPEISAIAVVDPTTVDVSITHHGGSDFTPTSGINGFEVLDDGTPVSLSSAVRSDGSTVRLTTSSSLTGTVTVRYLWGADGGVTFANAFSNQVVDNTSDTQALAWNPGIGTDVHATSGSPQGGGASVVGTAARTHVHTATGAVVCAGALITGTAARAVAAEHATSGALVAPGAAVSGSAAHIAIHATTGAIQAAGAEIAGSAARVAGAVSHSTTGALSGSGADVSGVAAVVRIHGTAGVLAGSGAVVSGSARNGLARARVGGTWVQQRRREVVLASVRLNGGGSVRAMGHKEAEIESEDELFFLLSAAA